MCGFPEATLCWGDSRKLLQVTRGAICKGTLAGPPLPRAELWSLHVKTELVLCLTQSCLKAQAVQSWA